MAPFEEEHQMIRVYKPNSVSGKKPDGSYLSHHDITAAIKRSTRRHQGEQPCLRNNPTEPSA